MSAPRKSAPGGREGIVLLEVLMALGFVAVIGVFLLGVLRNARVLDENLSESLGRYRERTRFFDSLTADLLSARSVVVDEERAGPAGGLVLRVAMESADFDMPTTLIAYEWDAESGALLRKRLLEDGRREATTLTLEKAVRFEPVFTTRATEDDASQDETLVSAVEVYEAVTDTLAIGGPPERDEAAIVFTLPVPVVVEEMENLSL